MDDIYTRSELVLGTQGMQRIKDSHVAVFGVGGVGGNVAEALVRGGVGEITLVDNDVVVPSNLNRQLVATLDTVGRYKTEAMRDRLLSINSSVKVNTVTEFFSPDNADSFDLTSFDFIADAIDSVSSKTELISRAYRNNIPIISSMGAGNKLHPEFLELADIYDTQVCPLARVMRTKLRALAIPSLRVVYSREKPVSLSAGQSVTGSTSFVPPAAGLIIAGEILRTLAAG